MNSEQPTLEAQAKAIVALALRNGPIEDVHAGVPCPTCYGQRGYSHITQAEMRAIMKTAVNRVHQLLEQREHDLPKYRQSIAFGSQYTVAWDDPEPDPLA